MFESASIIFENENISAVCYNGNMYKAIYDFEPNYDPDNGDGTFLWENFLQKVGENNEITCLCYVESSSLTELSNVTLIHLDEQGF